MASLLPMLPAHCWLTAHMPCMLGFPAGMHPLQASPLLLPGWRLAGLATHR
jgi:hypothetical protein